MENFKVRASLKNGARISMSLKASSNSQALVKGLNRIKTFYHKSFSIKDLNVIRIKRV
jgi:hypothetical protein